MTKQQEVIAMVLVDVLSLNVAYVLFYLARVRSGWFSYAIEPELLLPMIVMCAFWLAWFAFLGLYRVKHAVSRIDETITVGRTTGIGVLVLFFLIFIDDQSAHSLGSSRLLIAGYWAMLFVAVSGGRLALRSVQKRLVLAGIGTRNTLIVGWSDKAFKLCDMVLKYPSLGYKLVGFIRSGKRESGGTHRPSVYKKLPVLGTIADLPKVIEQNHIREILIGLDSTEHQQLLDVVKLASAPNVSMKIVPDLYDIVSGQARISSLYGFPMMEVKPQLIEPWEAISKRFLDIVVSLTVLVAGLPIWALLALAIKLDSHGAMLYKQDRIGRNGNTFKILKFRSMRRDAEKGSGPVWAGRNDPRVTRIGRMLRKTHFDEVPQFWNVLVGDMSLVGPRPERPYFVERLSKEIPLYAHRHRVRPGITGWAQVKHKYDETIDDVRAKLRYDLFYIENISWRMDLKILLNTIYVMVMGKGHT